MITRLFTYVSDSFNPYINLAAETFLLHSVEESEMILYLWRNENTVVVGRNQDIYSEVNLAELERLGTCPTRRLSGGGAVFHDKGNLNFTFICKSGDYDVEKQTSVILDAVKSLGISAEKTGRNDLCVGGRKFSGHSYYREADRCFHNGTILLNTSPETMERVLNVSKEKLESKGVKSVRSRTVNLCELVPDLTVDRIVSALVDSFEKNYGAKASLYSVDLKNPELLALQNQFSSETWIFNRKVEYSGYWSGRLEEGLVSVRYDCVNGLIRDCEVYSDALDTSYCSRIKEDLVGKPLSKVFLVQKSV